jgi:hypothetical protein
MSLPSIDIKSPNFATVNLPGGTTLYFSYRTLIGFTAGEPRFLRYVRRNDWGQTTGKHLNAIDGGSKEAKAARLDAAAFEEAYRRETSAPLSAAS